MKDSDIDRLYQVPLAEFIAERNALAKRAGARASEIRALPKPTLAVWAVNQLHWREPDIYNALVDSAENLRATHAAVMRGGRADLRGAGREHETALETALKATLRILADEGSPASDAVRGTIQTTLRALPGDDPPGRLRAPLMPRGFEALTGLPSRGRVIAAPAGRGRTEPAPKPAGKAAGKRVDKGALSRARKAAADAARAASAAEQAARREEFEAARAAREVDAAKRRVAAAQAAFDAARVELEAAQEAAEGATRKRDQARTRASAAERDAEAARARSEAARLELEELAG